MSYTLTIERKSLGIVDKKKTSKLYWNSKVTWHTNKDLNISPYYDDFDASKNFYKVLFKPGFPVQARELTTSTVNPAESNKRFWFSYV